jgi:formamidopyrimidine-DNA glycosylase
MPELPEVEFARRKLHRWLARREIERSIIPPSRITRGERIDLTGARVKSLSRRGKWLKLRLSTGSLFSHLGMTGKWVRRERGAPDDRFEKARLDVRDASIRYLDPRLFGRLLFVESESIPEWEELGPDPYPDWLEASPSELGSRSIKEQLLDQRWIAGVGNIQAAESLWRAKIHPERKASSLTQRELDRLMRCICESMEYTLAQEDGDEITYVEEGGENPFLVYAREGEPCRRCKTRLKRITQGGRSTVFCPRCQTKRS